MGSKVQLNYDELRAAVKKFRNEGEDIVHMHSSIRNRVHDLHKDWVGEGADKFFNEMENDLLPALTRLSRALFYAQDVLHKIIQTIQAFDEDTAGYFKIDFAQVNPLNLGAFLAGAGIAGGIGGMAGGSLPGGLPGAQGSGVGVPAGEGLSGVGATDSLGGSAEPVPGSQAGSGQLGGVEHIPGAGGQLSGSSAGAGGGGGSSQGQQDYQQGVGGGVGSQGGGGGGGAAMGGGSLAPDHIYDGSSGAGAGGSSAQTAQAAGSGGGGSEGSTANEGAVAAGAAGVAGSAALGVAGKTIKGRLRKKKR